MKFANNLDLALNELQNVRIQSLNTEPDNPVAGQIYFNTSDDKLKVYDGTTWTSLGETGGSGTPTGDAGGELAGMYPNPTIADGVIDNANIKASAGIVASKLDATSFNTQVRTSTLNQMATPTADLAMGSHKLTGVADPTGDQDAATKKYVDTQVAGVAQAKRAVGAVPVPGTPDSGQSTITHGLGTRDVMVQVYDATTYEQVVVDNVRTDTNTVTLSFATDPTANQYRYVILA